ncbi:msl6213 [Mesorhizobium japonicum MAFF 303099]|uniref:Msl6213 protein n=1 Tax=Mesorhizobium japonicum (strain LMG 29417 / CECT 9101 / MAFF 303099) TaxID=266835 RepID=Q98A03_RHILO|nr:msl6213 [Mesorhizobium japonicum MAFF 303099]
MRTFADWNEPLPDSMEMDLVAHCGLGQNAVAITHSLVLTDIASQMDRGRAHRGAYSRHSTGYARHCPLP